MLAAALSLAAVGIGFGTGTASAAASCPGWTGAQPPGSGNILGTTVLSACDVWVVGGNGGPDKSGALIEHWTGGSSWTVMNNPSPGSASRLFTAAGAAANDVWAVGEYEPVGSSHLTGLIEHWDGSSWAQVQSPVPGVGGNLLGVGAVSANDAWAVGFSENATDGGPSVVRTLIEHWDGSQWTPDAQAPSPGTSSFLDGVSVASATNIWAVGASVTFNPDGKESDTALIEHWDGTGWSVSPFSSPGIASVLRGVKVVSATNIWAVGSYQPGGSTSGKTLIEHWDGANWTQVPSPSPGGQLSGMLFSVTATSATSAWSAGRGGGDPLLLHWDGDAWSRVATPSAAAGDSLGAAQTSPDGATWIAGSGESAFAAPVLGAAQAEIAVNALGRNLRETGFVNGPPGNLSVAAGTGPAMAASPAGDFKVAWTAANDHLWTIDQAGHRTDTMTLVRAGTSPAITALSSGGYEIAFTGAADGQLWETGLDGVFRVAAGGVAVAPGTSPAIAASPAGGFEIAVHAAGSGDLTIVAPDGVAYDSGRQLAAGTSPVLAALATGGFEVAFTGADGKLWRTGPDGVFTLAGGGVAVAAGTSPAIAASAGGGFAIAVHASGSDDVWIARNADTAASASGKRVATGTSPAIAAVSPGIYQVLYEAAGTAELTVLQPDGLAIGTGVAMTAATSPAIAVPAAFATTAQVPNVLSTDLGTAENVITAVGLTVGQISMDNRCIDVAGGVLTQNPSAGVAVPLGTSVNMTVSSGSDTRGNPCIFQ